MRMHKQGSLGERPEFDSGTHSSARPFAHLSARMFVLAGALALMVVAIAVLAFKQPIPAALALAGITGAVFCLGAGLVGREIADDARVVDFMNRMEFAYVMLDENRRVSGMNDRARQLLGLADAEWQGCRWQTLLGGSASDAFSGALPEKGVRWSAVRPDCTAIGIHYQLVSIRVGDRVRYMLLLQDVGDLINNLREESESARIRTAACLATQIAHEVRNPVAAISGSAQLLGILNEKARQGDERIVQLLASEQDALCRSIVEESNRLEAIIGRFLSFSDLSEDSLRAVMELPEIKEDADMSSLRSV